MTAGGDGDSPGSKSSHSAGVEDAYREHAALLRDIAEKKFNIPPPDSAGIVHDVFSSFMVHRENIRDARQWLVGAVCHASRAYWRIAARTSQLPEDVGEYVDPDSPGLEGRIVDRVTMARALNAVGPKCRETLRLYYAEGYSAAEIANELGTTTGYVMQLLHTCRKRVRKAYDELRKDGRR
ncbi:MAG: sigma-70 family RNA polymerase sigma factor [Acidobacteriota bacterium]|nr:sigma-70 family RNA polymerase sigma factor [Acidobacteriota bacterium]